MTRTGEGWTSTVGVGESRSLRINQACEAKTQNAKGLDKKLAT